MKIKREEYEDILGRIAVLEREVDLCNRNNFELLDLIGLMAKSDSKCRETLKKLDRVCDLRFSVISNALHRIDPSFPSDAFDPPTQKGETNDNKETEKEAL